MPWSEVDRNPTRATGKPKHIPEPETHPTQNIYIYIYIINATL